MLNKETKSKLTLAEIKDIVNKGELNRFYRDPEIEIRYQKELKEQEQKNLNLRDVIELEHYRSLATRKRWIFRKNDYPYYLEDGLEHWILWDMHGNWDTLLQDCSHKLREERIIVSWINPPELCSVKDIPHIHTIIKSKN